MRMNFLMMNYVASVQTQHPLSGATSCHFQLFKVSRLFTPGYVGPDHDTTMIGHATILSDRVLEMKYTCMLQNVTMYFVAHLLNKLSLLT